MFQRKRNALISSIPVLAVMLLAAFLAACSSRPILIPIPVSTSGDPLIIVLATATPAADAASDETAATPAAADDDAKEEAAADTGDSAASVALVIPHKFEDREDCTECHEAGAGRHASPDDHAGYTDDLCLYCHEPEEDDIAMTPLPAEASADFCLACHGPYEDLMASTAGLLEDLDGVTANPHLFVPHDSDKILSCKNCHEVHDLPVVDAAAIPQADAGYCYNACHHEETFEPCANCHEEGSAGGE